MNDKQLLELAAKAAGLDHKGMCEDFFDPESTLSKGLLVEGLTHWIWNPLENDADAFRLMVDLDIRPLIGGKYSHVTAREVSVAHGADKHAATRRAIVKAAAMAASIRDDSAQEHNEC